MPDVNGNSCRLLGLPGKHNDSGHCTADARGIACIMNFGGRCKDENVVGYTKNQVSDSKAVDHGGC